MDRDDLPLTADDQGSGLPEGFTNDGYTADPTVDPEPIQDNQVKLWTISGKPESPTQISRPQEMGAMTESENGGNRTTADTLPELLESRARAHSNSRPLPTDWYHPRSGSAVNVDYTTDVGVRERRTSSNIKYAVLSEVPPPDSSASSSSTRPAQLNKYHTRWYVIIVFSLANFWIGMSFSTWGPIAHSMEFVFPFQDSHIALLSSLGLIGFIPMFPIYNWIVQTKGLRIPMLVGTTAMAIGGALRCGTYFGIELWWMLFVGQAIASLSVAIQGALGASLVATWFPTNERVLATALITLTAPVGSAASSVIGPQIVRDNYEDVVTTDNCTDEILRKFSSKTTPHESSGKSLRMARHKTPNLSDDESLDQSMEHDSCLLHV